MNAGRFQKPTGLLLTAGLLLALVMALPGPAPPAAQAASLVVDSLADGSPENDGACTLREAMINANANNQSGSTDCAAGSGADTITFAISGTIVVATTLPAASDAAGLTIDGAGQDVTLSGNNLVRVMHVATGASMTVKNLTISAGQGIGSCGANQNGGGICNQGTLTVESSTISNNAGSGIYNSGGTLVVRNSTFSNNNRGGNGGAIATSGGTLNVANSQFSGNSTGGSGGALNIEGTATVTNSAFHGNTSSGPGGAIRIVFGGELTIESNTISNSRATAGGGIYNDGTLVNVTNSTFTGNRATNTTIAGSGGGGILQTRGTVNVKNSTFVNNTTGSPGGGGDLRQLGTTNLTLKNSIVFTDQGRGCDGTITDLGGNLSYSGSLENNCPGINSDPLLDPNGLQDNGGPTQTIALQIGSAAIDAVTDCTDLTGNPVIQDHRGVERPQGAACDIGAYEFEPGAADTIPPVIQASIHPPEPAATGWYNLATGAPTISFTCGDHPDGSGLAPDACPADVTLGDGANQTISRTVTDLAGNTSDPVILSGINVDLTPPTVSGVSADRGPDHSGWYNASIVFSYEGEDQTSGIEACSQVTYSGPDSDSATVAGTCTDVAGNTSIPVASNPFQYDATPPVVSVTGVVDGDTYILGAVPEAGCDTVDNLSGVTAHATLTVSGGNSTDLCTNL